MTTEELKELAATLNAGEHAGTVEDPIPQKLLYTRTAEDGTKKVYTPAGTIIIGGGSGGSASPATDTVMGIVKLTDDASVDAPAATGSIAMTPNGVKTYIETKADEILQQAKDYTDQNAGGGGTLGYVVTPTITTPTDSATNVSTLPTIAATPYKNVFGTEDPRAHRVFQVSEKADFSDLILDENVNADSYQVTAQLSPNKTLYARVKDVASSGYESAWSLSVSFTTSAGLVANTPTVTLHGYADSPTDILSGVRITTSAYDTQSQDEHKATTWSISTKEGTRSVVWSSANDTTNKTEITVPDGTLAQSTEYILTVIYHGTKAFDSAPAIVEFTTSDDFGHVVAPTLSVEGGPNAVYETPLLTGGAFSNTRDGDTHDMSDWEILDSNGISAIWQSLNDTTNKTQIRVSATKLVVGTAYKARVRYHGTKYGWSQYTTVDFSTVAAFNVVNTPTITVQGAPDNIKETPILIGSPFAGTNVTHQSTDWIITDTGGTEIWSSKGDTTNLTSIKVPKGQLQVSTSYIFKVRYNANEGVSSEYGEATYTTAASFIRYNYIGVPGTSTFGVGLAEQKNYEAVGLTPAANCLVETDFQYALYTHGPLGGSGGYSQYGVALKWIPKLYIALLQKNQGTENLSDSELDALLPYVEVTKEQMKEAQRRSPHNAMVVAPSDMFTNEADANSHGFYLMRGFIDGGQEQDGFFIANTLTMVYNYTGTTYLSLGSKSQSYSPNLFRADNKLFIDGWPNANKAANAKGNFIATLEGEPWQCCSIFAWAVISVLSLIQGQYATDTAQCAWYDSTLVHNYPKGINQNNRDVDDATVTSDTVSASQGRVFVTQGYEKTTHNGSITGITNVNGWLWQFVIGSWGNGSKLLKRGASIYDITYDNVDNSGASFWETHDISNASDQWGGTKSSFPDLAGVDKDLFGVCAFGDTNSSNEFGLDYYSLGTGASILVGGRFDGTIGGGVFSRSNYSWNSGSSFFGFRAMAYPSTAPEVQARITLTANGGGGTPETQSVIVDSGTTLGDATAKLTQPTKTGYSFKGWA